MEDRKMDDLKRYFKKIHHQLETAFNKSYKKYGLTDTQLDVLIYLSQENNTKNTLTDIALHFGVQHTSVIHVLKLLEKRGFICKSTVKGSRTKPILLTDSGKQLVLKIRKNNPLLNEIMFQGLSETDQQLLEKMLRQIYTNLESDAFKNLSSTDMSL